MKQLLEAGKIREDKFAQDFFQYKLIENNIAKEYSYSYEVKMIKEYGLWLAENKPTDDYREQNFNTMQARIDNIKSDFVDIKIKAKELVLRYSKD